MRKYLFGFTISILASFFMVVNSYTQGETGSAAITFLLVSPYAEANSMGETSIAIDTDNPLASIFNPAHLGMQSLNTYFSAGINTSDWLPSFNLDLKYKTYAINGGLNLGKHFGFSPDLSIGLGYSHVYFDEGEQEIIITGETDPTPLGLFRYHPYESSDQWTIGIGMNYWVRISAGLTFKHITSKRSLEPWSTSTASVNAVDYGMLLDIPVTEILSRSLQSSFEIYPHINSILDLSLGFSRNNLGDKVIYRTQDPGDALPRTARIGIGFDIGALYEVEDLKWKIFSFKWTVEANDLLVRRLPDTTMYRWAYQENFGDINFFKDVILGNSNSKTKKGKGWELNFFEFAYVRSGRYEGTKGSLGVNTTGFGIRLTGIFKALSVLNPRIKSDKTVNFIFKHLDIRYNQSTYDSDGTKFNGINLLFTN